MAGLLLLLVYLLAGLFIIRCLLPGKGPLIRIWLGLSLGLFLLMWLPALLAHLRPFDATTQWLSLLGLVAVAGLSYLFREPALPRAFDGEERKTLVLLAVFALPLGLLMAYLQHSHILLPLGENLYTGQATYGDLPLHLAITTSLPGQVFPPQYSILPGTRLGYPFLANSLSSTLLLLGLPLRWAMILPGSLMSALVFSGYLLLARAFCKGRKAAALAFLFVFINGGLGFLYALDMAGLSLGSLGSNQLQMGSWWERIHNILTGWYQTPANHAEFLRYNLRISNLLVDLLLPQRTFLAGWLILLPCLYLLLDQLKKGGFGLRQTLLLGVLAGGLPLIHTHSFLALGLASLGFLLYWLVQKKPFWPFLLYGGLAVLLALPQLLAYTFTQSGADNFIRFQFNWVNNPGGQGLLDAPLFFYLKNLGLPFLLLLPALLEKDRWHRLLFAGGFVIVLVAEFIIFQPNEYDNNKLLYVAWALFSLPMADYALLLFGRLKGLRARPLMAAAFLFFSLLSGGLAISRESLSRYQMFSGEEVALADFIKENTQPDSRFITGSQHVNPVSSLAGRQVVVGPALWLHYHGLDTSIREADILAFYQSPEANPGMPETYAAQYILLGPHEQRLGGQAEAFLGLYPLVYQQGNYSVFFAGEE